MMVKQKSSFINFFCRAVQKISLYKKDEKICMGRTDRWRSVGLSVHLHLHLPLCFFLVFYTKTRYKILQITEYRKIPLQIEKWQRKEKNLEQKK